MKALHLHITGRVQGVGFRDWLVAQATARHLSGWVRNLDDDTVETLISGEDEAVDACVQSCHRGPPMARVDNLTQTLAAPPANAGFLRLPSMTRR